MIHHRPSILSATLAASAISHIASKPERNPVVQDVRMSPPPPEPVILEFKVAPPDPFVWPKPLKPIIRDTPKQSRNSPCFCGSGRKHKRCCGQNS